VSPAQRGPAAHQLEAVGSEDGNQGTLGQRGDTVHRRTVERDPARDPRLQAHGQAVLAGHVSSAHLDAADRGPEAHELNCTRGAKRSTGAAEVQRLQQI